VTILTPVTVQMEMHARAQACDGVCAVPECESRPSSSLLSLISMCAFQGPLVVTLLRC
jgi:hypothetical protein